VRIQFDTMALLRYKKKKSSDGKGIVFSVVGYCCNDQPVWGFYFVPENLVRAEALYALQIDMAEKHPQIWKLNITAEHSMHRSEALAIFSKELTDFSPML